MPEAMGVTPQEALEQECAEKLERYLAEAFYEYRQGLITYDEMVGITSIIYFISYWR